MLSQILSWARRPAAIIAALLFIGGTSACTVHFAPAYDQSIADGLTAASKDIQTLFASMSTGVPAATYSSRQDAYNKIIGELATIEQQIKVRPDPANPPSQQEINQLLQQHGVPLPAVPAPASATPSAGSVAHVADTIATMKTQDQSGGLHVDEVKAFAGQSNIYLAQAIAYETFLKR